MTKIKLDDIDHQILDILIDNTRVPFTDISKRLLISAGTVHVRVKKMEDAGIIKGSIVARLQSLGAWSLSYCAPWPEGRKAQPFSSFEPNRFHHLKEGPLR